MNVTHRRVYRSLGKNFNCLFTKEAAWIQMDRCELEKDQPKELWSVPEGAVPFFS